MTEERIAHIKHLERIVIAAGGTWVGVQETVPPMPDLVLFNTETCHSTLALPDDEFFTVNAVQDKIAASHKSFMSANIKIPRNEVRAMAQHFRNSAETLESYLKENKE